MCCNLPELVRSQEHWLWDVARKRNDCLLFSFYCFENPSIALNFGIGPTGPIQMWFSAKCTSPNEQFNLENWKWHMLYVGLQTDFPRLHHKWYDIRLWIWSSAIRTFNSFSLLIFILSAPNVCSLVSSIHSHICTFIFTLSSVRKKTSI